MVKEFSAERIFCLIDNQSVNVKEGARLIEIYALTKANEMVKVLRKDLGISYNAEIEAAIERVNQSMEQLLADILPG